ncbi:MAG: hypothetical protein K0Q91_324 [Fibrobacteria bacterium]|nr:hypothetical protein [Fibrobacteria bacterium]
MLFPARPTLSFAPLFAPLLVLAAVLGFAAPAAAQTYEVVGTIVDEGRGSPIAGVEIRMADGRKLGVSQASGRFEITVNSRQANIVFRRDGYRDLEVNLGDLPFIVDVDIAMEPNVQELAEQTAYAPRRAIDPSDAQSIEELESLQGMRMDLNDHLRQMHGIAGMNESTSDISVYGSRTQDVTHYLGKSRIPSLRHLDFGFPGNQSVLNPRLLRSVTLADNQARGPVNQGNASALVYDLKPGDPEAIHGDVVLGSVNRELNLTSYWGERTFTTSARYLDPNGLKILGTEFFTTPRDVRIGSGGEGCADDNTCAEGIKDPLRFTSLDIFFSTFKRDTTGAYSRHSLVIVDDGYRIQQEVATDETESEPQTLLEGFQGAWLYSYEALSPRKSGDMEWGFSFLSRDYKDAYRDTLPPAIRNSDGSGNGLPWYHASGNEVDNLIGNNGREDKQFILSTQWSPTEKTFGAAPSYGIELEYTRQTRRYQDLSSPSSGRPASSILTLVDRDLVLANALYRLRWNLAKRRSIEASAGGAYAYEGWRAEGESGTTPPLPLGSVRYTHGLAERQKVYVEGAARHSVVLEPTGFNDVAAKVTPSVEAKVGGDGFILDPLRYAWSLYSRYYKDPSLPIPEVFWNYEETREARYSTVQGVNGTFNYLPGHHVGMAVNASVIQGRYHLADGGTLPWESNRTLDLVYNLRYLPREDSLLSFIITYGAQNGAPLYEYRGLWDPAAQNTTGRRAVYSNTQYPTVSRQRLDARVNLDLKSAWRPLESVRFFFEADNIFSGFEQAWAGPLGGRNERRRGWTRAADGANGTLQPVVTRGLGLFIMFGIEGKLKI